MTIFHIKWSDFDIVYQIIGGHFVYAIRPHLQETWDDELEKAWIQLFRVLSYYMKKGIIDKKANVDWPRAGPPYDKLEQKTQYTEYTVKVY